MRQISSFEIKEYLNSNTSIDSQEISIKNGKNLKELLKKINIAVNENKNDFPTNIVYEALNKKSGLMNSQMALSFILIGDSSVGKNFFLTNYFKNQFNEIILTTISIDKEIKYVKIGDDIYKITLWDTAGQERFKCLPKKYYRNADGVLLLFDVTNEETFNSVSNWMKDIKENYYNDEKEFNNICYLIGNNIEKPNRVITRETGEAKAKFFGMKYFEVICKINLNIQEVMARMIMECHLKSNHIDNSFKLKRAKTGDKKSGEC